MSSLLQWFLELEDETAAVIPVPRGHPFVIQGIHAPDSTAAKIVLNAVVGVVRLDTCQDSDTPECDVCECVIAVVFPQMQPDVPLYLQFSAFNTVSVKATGGKLVVTGLYDAAQSLGVE
jgi:hypothetical protein